MPTEEQIIQNYFTDLELQTLGYMMFVLNTCNSIDEVKEIVQKRIDKLNK